MLGDFQVAFSEITGTEWQKTFGLFSEGFKLRDLRPACGYNSFTLGAERAPLLCCLAEGRGDGITSQIALKFVRDAVQETALSEAIQQQAEDPAAFVQEALRESNRRVYEYGHRMLAGGKFAATGVLAVLDDKQVTIGKVGDYECYLWRGGRLIRFFQQQTAGRDPKGIFDRFVGANAQVLVDLATLSVVDGDILILGTLVDSEELRRALESALVRRMDRSAESLAECSHHAVRDAVLFVAQVGRNEEITLKQNILFAFIEVGPTTTVLSEVVG